MSLISAAGPVNRVLISDRQTVRLLLHIFVFSLQPDEPTHAAAPLPLQQKHKGSAGFLVDPGVNAEIFLSVRARLVRAEQSVLAGFHFNCCFRLETP